jgi:hypothetical protein
VLEFGHQQHSAVLAIASDCGLVLADEAALICDLAGKFRCIVLVPQERN